MRKKLWYTSPSAHFNEALAIGNGRLGAMVYSGEFTDKLTLNEDTLWSGAPEKNPPQLSMEAMEGVRKLVLEGKYAEADKALSEAMIGCRSQAYMPAGSLTIENYTYGAVTDYYRELDLENAIVSSSCNIGDCKVEKECFASAPDGVIAYRIKCGRKMNFRLHLDTELKLLSYKSGHKTLTMQAKCPSHVDQRALHVEYDDSKESINYAIGIAVESDIGAYESGTSIVAEGTEVTFYVAIETSFAGFDKMPQSEGRNYRPVLSERLENAKKLGYEKLKERHIADYKQLFDRVKLELGEPITRPTNERIANPEGDSQLIELLFDFGRYLMISGSREGTQPLNLQGIWNERVIPPWLSNYTMNINTEMNYWPAEACDLGECHEPLFGLVRDLAKKGNDLGLPGWTSYHNSDLWRFNHAATKEPLWGFWMFGGFWSARDIWEHYVYTGDKAFLADNVSILRGACEFLKAWMIERDGKLTVCPSTSPENTFRTPDGNSAVAEGSAMELTICREMFINTSKACAELGEEALSEEYKAIAERIKPLGIGSDGRLLEWNEEFEETEKGHRHLSHLYGVFPSDMIAEGTPEYAAAKKSLDFRLAHSAENGSNQGWSNSWKACLFVEYGDKIGAGECLMAMFRDSMYPNMFDKHPPFQIDGNFGITAAICNMIAEIKNGKLRLLHGLPDFLPDGKIEGLCLRGGKKINMTWSGGKVENYEITDR